MWGSQGQRQGSAASMLFAAEGGAKRLSLQWLRLLLVVLYAHSSRQSLPGRTCQRQRGTHGGSVDTNTKRE